MIKRGQKGSKRAKKWLTKGAPLVCHLAPWKIPMKIWLAGHFWTPPGGVSGGPPPSGGDFSASRPRGGVPPLGGAPKGPKKGHFWPFLGVFPQLGVYGKKRPKNVHFIGVLAEFRPKI